MSRTMNPPPLPPQASVTYPPSIVPQSPTFASNVPIRSHGSKTPLSSTQNAAFSSDTPAPFLSSVEPSEARSTTSSLPPRQSSIAHPLSLPSQHPQNSTNSSTNALEQHTSLASSSPPTSSAKSAINITNDPRHSDVTGEPATTTNPKSALLASLRDSTYLYDLPHVKLEQLVGDVVREEGFAKLASQFILSIS
ncbi:hypothetical protein H0H87_003749 [Tephrocybe sp. NHM501043]|nr:hypothetical protein H0H87_003749 [Tephrocybe sp. NHM501043]